MESDTPESSLKEVSHSFKEMKMITENFKCNGWIRNFCTDIIWSNMLRRISVANTLFPIDFWNMSLFFRVLHNSKIKRFLYRLRKFIKVNQP